MFIEKGDIFITVALNGIRHEAIWLPLLSFMHPLKVFFQNMSIEIGVEIFRPSISL